MLRFRLSHSRANVRALKKEEGKVSVIYNRPNINKYFRPCAGNYRQQNQNKYQFDSRNNQLDMSAPKPKNDIFNPDWGDNGRPTISSPIREDAPLKSKPDMPPKPVKPSKPIKPPKPQKPVSSLPKQTPQTSFGLVETKNDPFAVDWGDSNKSRPHRSAPEPPKPPTPPPKDY